MNTQIDQKRVFTLVLVDRIKEELLRRLPENNKLTILVSRWFYELLKELYSENFNSKGLLTTFYGVELLINGDNPSYTYEILSNEEIDYLEIYGSF